MKINSNTAKLALILILPIIAISSYIYFEKKAENKDIAAKSDPAVAGLKAINISDYFGKDLPLLPDSEITSLYSSQNQLNLIIESNQAENNIENFYKDYFFKNGWQKIDKNTFQKESQKMELNISGNLIKLRIYK
jgi:hypothetical protein